MEFIKKHKAPFIVGIVCLILLILAFFAIYRMFYPSSSKSVYGDRLENAPEIDNAVIEKIKKEILDSDLAIEVTYETKVATMKFFVDVKYEFVNAISTPPHCFYNHLSYMATEKQTLFLYFPCS